MKKSAFRLEKFREAAFAAAALAVLSPFIYWYFRLLIGGVSALLQMAGLVEGAV